MEDILTTRARQFLSQMEPEERAGALRSLKKMIDEEFFKTRPRRAAQHLGAALCFSRR